MLVTLLGMSMDVRPEQPMKAQSPMLVTLLPMVTDVRPLQSLKACSPMLVTLLGMSMEVRLVQPQKALPPMLVTLVGMIVFLHPAISVLVDFSMIALQLFRESYLEFSEFTVMDVRLEQPEYL